MTPNPHKWPSRDELTEALALLGQASPQWLHDYLVAWDQMGHSAALQHVAQLQAKSTDPLPNKANAAGGQIKLLDGYYANDYGYVSLRPIREPYLLRSILVQRERDVERRLTRAKAAGFNTVSVLATSARSGAELTPDMLGYDRAFQRLIDLMDDYGFYLHLTLVDYRAFAHADAIKGHGHALTFVNSMAERTAGSPNIILQLANLMPPLQQEVLAYYDTAMHHRRNVQYDIILSPVHLLYMEQQMLDMVCTKSHVLAANFDLLEVGDQWRPWLAYLQAIGYYRRHYPKYAFWYTNPPLASSKRVMFHTENDPEVHLTAGLIAAAQNAIYVYNYISEDNDGVPGLDLWHLTTLIPQTPAWQYVVMNDDAFPAHDFQGYDGVVGTTNGTEAWIVAWGDGADRSIAWKSGWTPDALAYDGTHCTLMRVKRE